MLSQENLKQVLEYDPDSGTFMWIRSKNNRVKIGTIAGTINNSGTRNKSSYLFISINRRKYPAHRLAFLYMNGEFPSETVDHIDGDGLNNKWGNLREVTITENLRNRPLTSNNKSGVTGVMWNKQRNGWIAKISVNKERIFLYHGKDFDAACAARRAAEIKYGFHPNHGRA